MTLAYKFIIFNQSLTLMINFFFKKIACVQVFILKESK